MKTGVATQPRLRLLGNSLVFNIIRISALDSKIWNEFSANSLIALDRRGRGYLIGGVHTGSIPDTVIVSYPCGRGGRAWLVFELRSLPSHSCVRRHPFPASLWVQQVPVRCTLGSGWRSRVYPASARTLHRRRRRF